MRNILTHNRRFLRPIVACVWAMAIVLGTVAIAPPISDAQTTQRRRTRFQYTIRNNSSYDIHRLYMSSSENEGWGADLLGTGIMRAGETFRLTNITAGEYDLKVVDEDGDECQLFNIMVCGNGTYTFTNQNLLQCEGYR